MFKSKSLLKSLTVVSALSVGLAACGNDADENNDPANEGNNANDNAANDNGDEAAADEEAPEAPEELTMWVNDEESQLEAYGNIVEGFEEEHGIEVDITEYSMLDQTEGMSLDGPAGQGPDLFFQPHDRMGDVALQGLARALDLTDDQQERLEGYNPEAVESFSYEGEQYGIPAVVETYALFYNQSMVDEAPENLDELNEMAEELTDDDTYGFMMDATDFYFTYPFLTAHGGYVFAQDDDGVYDPEDIGLNEEGVVEGAEMIQSWYQDGPIPDGADGDAVDGTFTTGDTAMVVSGPWNVPFYSDELGDDLGVSKLPAAEEGGDPVTSFSGNKGWLVNEYTEEEYWATELALYITNAESSEEYFETAQELPAHEDVEIDDEFFEPIFAQTEYTQPMPNIPEMSQVWDPMADALEFISQGDDPQEVLDEAVEQIHTEIGIMNQ
ncbi:sugar ABC transporter substrate-binding protein [Salisediminibacterium halotolerans]|uniref:Maltodextrin-binding protein n=1 Tax=Salisediminibacterium halotolerans TaxID=517425 RepID=A0A1H9VG43_9BACI|nr:MULTISPECIES: extracellular solute-binding protein [Salisediminibacterium]RLJ74475.1 carbohydrate ABC transporter substrate-binding protein (CUT1 family) [Actinophytocola xinjiangensis]RPE87432.1 carbohydrate ABC transporter substrate-binding protein (CUT1 family) [Salisediminibacterium halotolerans]TWG35311.1 carbohydrate ABC transporter substrate-binding protein (CUT1 family) [Salisediminibacterium halotolerans]SES20521.1 arabinogalactan oligomer / maltooligosaccharide transport system sub